MIAGPFDNPGHFNGASFYAARAPEADWNRSASYPIPTGTAGWRPIVASNGELRFTDAYSYEYDKVAYAMTDLVADKACKVRVQCSVDYALYLWLNGAPLFDSNAVVSRGAPSPTEFTIEVPFEAGRNRLAAKVAPGSLGWAMWMQFAAPLGATVLP